MGKLSQFQYEAGGKKTEKTQEEQLKEKYNTFKNMNQNELHNQLYREVARQKSSGTFDYNALSNMLESLRGALSENDYNNIKRILDGLK